MRKGGPPFKDGGVCRTGAMPCPVRGDGSRTAESVWPLGRATGGVRGGKEAGVATEKVRRQGAIHRIGALAGLLLTAAALLTPSATFAQTSDAPPPRPVKARDAMRNAQECYRRGDYEGAAKSYQDADANKQQLGPSEQADLADLIKANNTALEASRNGARAIPPGRRRDEGGQPAGSRQAGQGRKCQPVPQARRQDAPRSTHLAAAVPGHRRSGQLVA